jgi:hypothetical protein
MLLSAAARSLRSGEKAIACDQPPLRPSKRPRGVSVRRESDSAAGPRRREQTPVRAEVEPEHRAAAGAQPQWNRALWVYEQLSARGGAFHRSVKHPDLLIAAAAEAADVGVLHYDEDYDRIAAITGQPTRWLAPKGTLR